MKKTLFIHVGYPKTGTTTLQKNVFPNISNLTYLGKYHDKKEFGNITAQLYPLLNGGINGLEEIYKKIKKNITNSKNNIFLISDEAFTAYNYGNIEYKTNIILQLRKYLLNICNISIIMTVRKQSKIIPSYYAQAGYELANNFKEYVKQELYSDNFNYYNTYLIYKKKLNDNSIYIWSMEEIFQDSYNWIEKISKYLHISDNEKKYIYNILNNNHSNKRNLGKNLYKINNKNKIGIIIKFSSYIYKKTLKPYYKNRLQPPKYIQSIIYLLIYLTNIFKRKEEKESLVYSEEEKNNILLKFEKSNKLLDQKFQLNLKKYNYY